MEFINNIELQGVVGQIRVTDFEGDRLASISLRVDADMTSVEDGSPVDDITWFHVSAAQAALDLPRDLFDNITNGDFIHVTGRLRMRKFVTVQYQDRMVPEVVASTIEKVIPEDNE